MVQLHSGFDVMAEHITNPGTITRELFLPAYGYTDGVLDYHNDYSIVKLADMAVKKVSFSFKVPEDFVSFVSVKAVWASPVMAGLMRWKLAAHYGAAGESATQHSDTPAVGDTATGGVGIWNVQEPANPLTFVDLALGDYVGITLTRDIGGTLGASAYVLGLLFTYTAEQVNQGA